MKKRTININPKKKKKISVGFWARTGIVLAAGYVFIQKDVNFQVNMQSPMAKQIASTAHISSPKAIKQVVSKKRKIIPKKQPRLRDASAEKIAAFIKRFSHVAESEQQKFGIPASIILANGLLQSAAGQTDFAHQANNYFNIPCDIAWNGEVQDFDGICFRKYESAWAGFRGHSQYLAERFGHLKKYGSNYKSWANGMEQGKYANQTGLSRQLITIVEKYNLNRFD